MFLYRSGFFGLVFSINLAVSNQSDRMESGSVKDIFRVVVQGMMPVVNKAIPGAGGWEERGHRAELARLSYADCLALCGRPPTIWQCLNLT